SGTVENRLRARQTRSARSNSGTQPTPALINPAKHARYLTPAVSTASPGRPPGGPLRRRRAHAIFTCFPQAGCVFAPRDRGKPWPAATAAPEPPDQPRARYGAGRGRGRARALHAGAHLPARAGAAEPLSRVRQGARPPPV